jgi:hypothetical protein
MQIQTILSQATALSAEVDMQRRTKIASMFPPASFVEETFVPKPFPLSDPHKIIGAVSEVGTIA